MLIQRGSNSENLRNVDKPDFFFNYFSLGMVNFFLLLKKKIIN